MALWPFGKKKDDASNTANTAPAQEAGTRDDAAAPAAQAGAGAEVVGNGAATAASNAAESGDFAHDPINGASGPFDGDSVDINDFDFSDYATGILDLGAVRVPLPKGSQVQVEMGETGPRMIHIVTEVGRMTPVAFAAPRTPGQWADSVRQLTAGMSGDGLETRTEPGPWGDEVIGENPNGTIRFIGVEGPRWMLRVTLAAPAGKDAELAAIAREMVARTFVYRGNDPVLAGNSLQMTMPGPLVEQINQAMQQRQQAASQAAQASAGATGAAVADATASGSGQVEPTAEDQAREQMRQLKEEQDAAGER